MGVEGFSKQERRRDRSGGMSIDLKEEKIKLPSGEIIDLPNSYNPVVEGLNKLTEEVIIALLEEDKVDLVIDNLSNFELDSEEIKDILGERERPELLNIYKKKIR